MNQYYLLIEFNNGRDPEKWGPYETREQAVAVKEGTEYYPHVVDIRLKTEPA